ncbi:MAG: DNA mismatch repair protein MutS [Deltaproteobacteria bacterium]|nr:DNA mismatch repair protein MutS [Deltaproteobacteria bacterium]
MDRQKLTPVMRQYFAAKQLHPDAILFFRLGDFYEMFYDDAVTASRLLDLTLTSRNKGDPDEVPMAGVPYHAATGYIAKLLVAGQKVAICEQMADPSKTKGIVPREVVRVITPGLVTDDSQLEARANHYLCAIDEAKGQCGIALLDLSTGELLASAVDPTPAAVMAELARVEPREVIVSAEAAHLRDALAHVLSSASVRVDEPIEDDDVGPTLIGVIGEAEAREATVYLHPAAVRASARALRMAASCTPGVPLPVRRIVPLDPSSTLQIDEIAQTHLELTRSSDGGKKGSLLAVVDATRTGPGARLLRRWLLTPLYDVAGIRRRQDAVEALVADAIERGRLRDALSRIGDIERLAVRAVLGDATPRDLGVLRDSLIEVPKAVEAVAAVPEASAREALGIGESLPDMLVELRDLLARALVDRPPALAREGGIIREGFDASLDETALLQRQGADLIVAMEAELRATTAIATLKIRYTRVFGWYIEVTRSNVAKVPQGWRRKQTVAGGERFTTDELDELADKLLHAEERHGQREAELFAQLVRDVARSSERLRALASLLARWDVFGGLAEVAHARDYRRPLVDDSEVIEIEDGRHPVVEQLAAAGRFVPNDVKLDTQGERLWLITGPNMAGKSTLMRQVAHIVVLAQMGSFVPAKAARIGVVDRILSRVGASDNVSRGESTFMVEMRETASILRKATRRSFVILDEIGRGTSTYDGLAIAWAVAEHLHDIVKCRTLFATHYHELTELANVAKNAANYSVSARERGDDVVFLYKLVKGATSRSYGVAVARLAGVSETVLARSRAILAALESGSALPGGRYSTLRGRSRAGGVQLDLFGGAGAQEPPAPSPVLETLKAVEPERLTPMDALQLVVKLKGMLDAK